MNKAVVMRKLLFSWIVLSFLMLISALTMSSQRAHALPEIDGVGFVQEEGEYLSDTMWSNSDWIDVGAELIASGGTASFELMYLGAKYVVSAFFRAAIKPIEFWLSFVHNWRDETGQRAPEEFRMLTGFVLDEQVDIAWLQSSTYDLSVEEGWDHLFPVPWATQDDQVSMEEFDGSMALIGMAGYPTVDISPRGFDKLQKAAMKISMRGKASKVFERYVNHLAKAGYLEKELGIKKGAQFIDLTYNKFANASDSLKKIPGVNGVDGFFINPDGTCYLLEMKWYAKGGGRLGKIDYHGIEIIQTSPEWLCRVLSNVRASNPKYYGELMRSVNSKRFAKFMEMVEINEDGYDEILVANPSLKSESIKAFTCWNDIIKYVKNKKGVDGDAFIEAIRKFVVDDIHVPIVSKGGRAITNLGKSRDAWLTFAEKLEFERKVEKTVHAANIAALAKRIFSARCN